MTAIGFFPRSVKKTASGHFITICKACNFWKKLNARAKVGAILGTGILLVSSVFGADDLPETVVTASRDDEDAATVKSTVEVVGREEFLEEGYRTVPEALAETPGVWVQKTTHGHGSPFVR